MAANWYAKLAIVCAVCVVSGTVSAQKSYELLSLDGKRCVVAVENDWQRKQCRIAYGSQVVCAFDNWYGEIKSGQIAKQFLQISYARGGGNWHIPDLMILCIYKGRLFVALNVEGNSGFYSGDPIIDYRVHTEVVEKPRSTFELKIKTNYREDRGDKTSKSIQKSVSLLFDSQKHIFYQKFVRLSGRYLILDIKDYVSKWRTLRGNYPSISINSTHYYFIDGIWYRDNGGVRLNAKKPVYKSLEKTYTVY